MGRRDPAVLGHTAHAPRTRVDTCGVRQAQAALPPSTHDLSQSYRSALLSRTLLHVPRDATAFSAAATGALAVDGVTAWPPAGGQQRSSERQAALQPSTRDLSGSYRSALLSRTLLHVPRDATSFAAASKAETHPDECGVNGFAEVAGRARRCCSSCVLLLDVCHAGTSWLLRARVCCCCTLGLLYLLAAFISCGLCIAVCIFCNAAPAPAPLPPQGGVCTDAVHFCSAPPAAALTCWAIFAI